MRFRCKIPIRIFESFSYHGPGHGSKTKFENSSVAPKFKTHEKLVHMIWTSFSFKGGGALS